jgi:hypothetical protein
VENDIELCKRDWNYSTRILDVLAAMFDTAFIGNGQHSMGRATLACSFKQVELAEDRVRERRLDCRLRGIGYFLGFSQGGRRHATYYVLGRTLM